MKESYFTVVTALILRAGRTYQHLLGSLRLWAHWGSVGLRIVAKVEIVDFVGEVAPPYQLLSSHFSRYQADNLLFQPFLFLGWSSQPPRIEVYLKREYGIGLIFGL